MYDDEGLAWSYGTHHKVDDRDDAEALPAGAASRSQTGLVDPDQWMNEDHAEQGGRGRDPYSLRRTRSDHSLASVAASEYQHSSAGAGAQRSKSRSRLFGGGKKTSRGAADRHARSDWVMGNPDNRLDPSMARRGDVGYYDGYGYGYASRESLRSVSTPSAGAGRSAGSRADAESFEGPEDADDNYGRRYRRTGAGAGAGAGGRQLNGGGRAGGGKDLPLPPQAHRDVMDVHHEF